MAPRTKKKRHNQGTTFFIPNTSQGRALLAQMRFRLNRKHWSISVMGRGPRKGKGLRHPQSYLNLAHAVTQTQQERCS